MHLKPEQPIYRLPAFLPAGAFSLGTLLGLFSEALPKSLPTLCVCFFSFLLIFQSYKRIRLLIAVSFFFCGMLYGHLPLYKASHDIAYVSPKARVALWGKVASTVEKKQTKNKTAQSFLLDVSYVTQNRKYRPKTGTVQVFLLNSKLDVHAGDFLRIYGTLDTPFPPTNPGQFDYAAYLEKNGVSKSLFAIGTKSVRVIPSRSEKNLMDYIREWRASIRDKFDRLFAFPNNTLAAALLVGIKKPIPPDIRDDFVKTGTAHLLAISGLNITLVAGFFYFILRRLGLWPQKINAAVVLAGTILYTFLAGANPPVLRAGLMAMILLVGIVMEQSATMLNSLLIAFLALIVFDPKSLLLPSFQLSFTAVLALGIGVAGFQKVVPENMVAGGPNRENRPPVLRLLMSMVRMDFNASCAAFVGLFPIIAFYFHIVSPVSFLANAFIAPIFLAVNALLIALLPFAYLPEIFARWCFLLPEIGFKMIRFLVALFAKCPGAYFYVASPTAPQMAFYYGGLLVCLFLWKKKWARILGPSLVVLALSCWTWNHVKPRPFEMTFLDFKKQSVFFIGSRDGTNFLIEDGPSGLREKDIYIVLKPFLSAKAVRSIDEYWIFIPHKKKHEGLETFRRHFQIRNLFFERKFIWREQTKHRRGKWLPLEKRFFVEPIWVRGRIRNVLYSECAALKISAGRKRIFCLLSTRAQILEDLANQSGLKSDVLYLPHFRFFDPEASRRLVERIAPEYVIMSRQKCEETIETHIRSWTGAQVYGMTKTGAVTMKIDHSRLALETTISA